VRRARRAVVLHGVEAEGAMTGGSPDALPQYRTNHITSFTQHSSILYGIRMNNQTTHTAQLEELAEWHTHVKTGKCFEPGIAN
jgi:hypothetical protein